MMVHAEARKKMKPSSCQLTNDEVSLFKKKEKTSLKDDNKK